MKRWLGWLLMLALLGMVAGIAMAQDDAATTTDSMAAESEAGMDESAGDTAALSGTVDTDFGLPGLLGEAIRDTPAGTGPGQIDPSAEPGFAGIPGAPQINYIVAVLWAIWVGWIFSTVGAFGGIMAGVGHLTVFGLGDYGKTFSSTNPMMNKLLTDTIRVSNQFLVGTSAAVSSFNYWRKGQLVAPLGIALGLGSISGGFLIPWLTAGKIDLSSYIGWFGLIVFVIGGFLLYQLSPAGSKGQKKAKAAAKQFQQAVKTKATDETRGVKVQSATPMKVVFTFYGVEFSFSPLLPFIGGIVIAGIASFLGIGGGFLYVPFMTSLVGLPMFLVAGTSALCVLLSMLSSIITFIVVGGTFINWQLVGVEMIGIFIGSMIGPRTQRFIPDKVLKIIFIVLAIYVGLRYFSKGFFGESWVPPY